MEKIIKEIEVDGYISTITQNGNHFTITNTFGGFRVVKKWENDTEEDRPSSIQVQLYQNNNPYGNIVQLNKDNNWRHSWKGLDPKATWHVVEKEYIEYSVIVERKGNTFLIHNTYIYDVPPPPPLDDTGVLWWPVPILIVGGLFFILLGVMQTKKSGYDHEI